MSVVGAQTRRRWLVVVVVATGLCALPAIIAARPAGTVRIGLATLTARIAASAGQPYQGDAVATGSLGLPSLPELADVADLFDGDTSLRIWYASPQRWRVDTIEEAGERDVYQGRYQGHSAQSIWDSGQSQLTTIVGSIPARLPRGADLAPPDLARRMLAAARLSSTAISALPPRRVGGFTAAGIRLTPSDQQTTIGYVDIWADPRTGLPVEVAVTPTGASRPMLVSRMLDVSTTAPAAATMTPPPASANVGSYVTSNPDVYTTLLNLGLGPLPATLAGLPRTDVSQPGTLQLVPPNPEQYSPGRSGSGRPTGPPQPFLLQPDGDPGVLSGIAAYGQGFEQVVAVSVPGRVGDDALDSAIDVGTSQQTPHGVSVVVSTPLLNLLVVSAERTPYTVFVAGSVTPDLLMRAATELIAFEEQGR